MTGAGLVVPSGAKFARITRAPSAATKVWSGAGNTRRVAFISDATSPTGRGRRGEASPSNASGMAFAVTENVSGRLIDEADPIMCIDDEDALRADAE